MDFVRTWITNITVVIIFIMLLDMIIPNSDMKRFVKVIMGLLIILVIIKPFITAKEDLSEQFQLSMVQASTFIEQSNEDNKGDSVSVFQNTAALDIYKQKLTDKIIDIVKSNKDMENKAVRVNVDIENDINKKEFGSIKGVQVFVEKGVEGPLEASRIEPVKINAKTVINKKQSEYNLNNSKLSQDLRSEIEKVLGLRNADISIEIQE